MTIKNGRVYQIGIVSWGVGCGHARRPGVYTSILYHFDWIQRIVCNEVEESAICLANDQDDEDEQIDSTNETDGKEKEDNDDDDGDRSHSDTTTDQTNSTNGIDIVGNEMGAQVCENNDQKPDGEVCQYGGQCCSGRCSRSSNNNDSTTTVRTCQRPPSWSRRILAANPSPTTSRRSRTKTNVMPLIVPTPVTRTIHTTAKQETKV